MNLPAFSIKYHVLTYMLSLVLILFGTISYQRIGVDRFPAIEFPMLSISTILPGADPEIIDASVTNIIESAVNGVSGIESIQSSSLSGISAVMIQFALEKNVDVAFNEVQAKINEVIRLLPSDAETPIVKKVDISGTPIMWLALKGNRTLQQLNVYARNVIKKRLETINGVGNVVIAGERKRTIRVDLEIQKLNNLGLTINDVIQSFQREHIKLPGGFLINRNQEKQLKLDLEYHDVKTIEQLIISFKNHLPVYLSDIANVSDGLEDFRKFASYNGEQTVGLGLVKIAGSNTIEIVEEAKRRLQTEIIPILPPGMELITVIDDADIIVSIVKGLQNHLIEGTLLAALVVWFFLKNLRSTLIISTAIPVSLLGAIAAIYFSGYTFNTMTLLGLLLLIGIVVDDAIVVLENIYRHMEKDDTTPAKTIAERGTNQVMFAVLAATITICSLFGAVVFMEGIIGRFIGSFAVVVVFGVVVSLFVSLTLTPMLCARYLKIPKSHGLLYRILESFFKIIEKGYLAIITASLRQRLLTVIIALAVVYSSGWFMGQLGKGFMPDEDINRMIVSVKTPLGSSIEYTRTKLEQIENIIKQHQEVSGLFSAIGTGERGQVNQAELYVSLISKEQRQMSQSQLIEKFRIELAQVAGVQVFAAPVPIVGGQRGEPLQFVLTGPELKTVGRIADQLKQKLQSIPEMGSMDSDLQLNMPQLKVTVNRAHMSNLGLDSMSVANTLRVLVGGLNVAKYNDASGDSERYDIRLKAEEGALNSIVDLNQIYLKNRNGKLVRLDSTVEFAQTTGPAVIGKYNLKYAATFFATPTISEGDAANIVLKEASDVLPTGYQIELIGRAKEFKKTIGFVLFAFTTGIILVYMTLASQFNSFIQPLIVMTAQPLAIIGGVFALWVASHTLNIYSMIGLVLLVGLVAKNSILLIDLTNQLRNQGEEINEALLEACPIRMRPVLMTSLTIILAMTPAAIGVGPGSDTNAPLAVAVIGGMVSSTLLTLIVVPAVYSLIEHGLEHIDNLRRHGIKVLRFRKQHSE